MRCRRAREVQPHDVFVLMKQSHTIKEVDVYQLMCARDKAQTVGGTETLCDVRSECVARSPR